MYSAVTVTVVASALLAGLADHDRGALAWGDSWLVYGQHEKGPPRTENATASGGWSNCHPLSGQHGIRYVQCDQAPGGRSNVFDAVVPREPGTTPEALRDKALRRLRPPAPVIETAPPRGADGLVGLPHYFWLPQNQWTTLRERATAGPAWAEVVARPAKLTIDPGQGQDVVTCTGLGVPYDHARSPDDQDPASCTHVFTESSAGLPGSQYRVTVSVVWTASWTGSGGAGGALPPITRTTTFPLRVAEGQALVRGQS
ncbi:hypothetical protein [Spongiactinospora rosea]|uniref:hypothetical protein n=1 Tax=Spongiactinospora rosea TaxID=2248750 RepID=UPI0011C01D87|nr:hypothetical protein [Spongiactinospora rosea]